MTYLRIFTPDLSIKCNYWVPGLDLDLIVQRAAHRQTVLLFCAAFRGPRPVKNPFSAAVELPGSVAGGCGVRHTAQDLVST